MTDTFGRRTGNGGQAVRSAALGGVIGPILFTVLVIAAGLVYDGYSHVSQKISELGGQGAEYAILQNLNFAVLGVLILGFSWALARVLGPPYLGPALIAYFGLITVVQALLPCDIGCQGRTTIGLLHNVTGLSSFIATIVGMFMLAGRWRDDRIWQSHAGFTRSVAFVAVGGLAWFVITQALDAQSFSGIAQRVFVGALLLWIAVTAWKLLRHLGTDTSPSDVEAGAVTTR